MRKNTNRNQVLKDKFERIFNKSYQSMLIVLITKCGNYDDALELAQEAFKELWKHLQLGDIRKPANFVWWKMSLLLIDYYRKKDRIQNAWQILTDDTTFSLQPAGEGTEVTKAIKKLSPDKQAIVNLFYYQGLSTQQIAVLLKIKRTTVTSTLSRARKEIRGYLFPHK